MFGAIPDNHIAVLEKVQFANSLLGVTGFYMEQVEWHKNGPRVTVFVR